MNAFLEKSTLFELWNNPKIMDEINVMKFWRYFNITLNFIEENITRGLLQRASCKFCDEMKNCGKILKAMFLSLLMKVIYIEAFLSICAFFVKSIHFIEFS